VISIKTVILELEIRFNNKQYFYRLTKKYLKATIIKTEHNKRGQQP